jgi:hypothetical protein
MPGQRTANRDIKMEPDIIAPIRNEHTHRRNNPIELILLSDGGAGCAEFVVDLSSIMYIELVI